MSYTSTSAELSPCRRFRFELRRTWDPELPTVTFCGLNPSTADASLDDPTIRKEVAYAKRWGYGSLIKVNAYAFRATDPKALKLGTADAQYVGDDNDRWISRAALEGFAFVAAWGNHITELRQQQVLRLVCRWTHVYALRITQADKPSHPLYLPGDYKPIVWKERGRPERQDG
jgi:hypothetical protein